MIDYNEIDIANGKLAEAESNVRQAYSKQIQKLQENIKQKIEILKEALQFYADGRHVGEGLDMSGRPQPIVLEYGYIARQALKKVTIVQDSATNLKQPIVHSENSLENLRACAPQTPIHSDTTQSSQTYLPPLGSISIGKPSKR